MADFDVNSQITDSVSQSFAAVVGNSPAESKSMLDALMAETVGMAMYNAVTNQHNAQMVSNAAMTAACARMLKTPFASPIVAAGAKPVIASVTPSPVPLAPATGTVAVTGSSFDPQMMVEITQNSIPVTVLVPAQLSNFTDTGFSFPNTVFAQAGQYGIRVRSSAGVASETVNLSVAALPPTISGVAPCSGGVTVTGNYFMPSLTAAITDPTGKAVTGVTTSAVTPTSCTVLSATALSGMYNLKITNPNGDATASFPFSVPAPAPAPATT